MAVSSRGHGRLRTESPSPWFSSLPIPPVACRNSQNVDQTVGRTELRERAQVINRQRLRLFMLKHRNGVFQSGEEVPHFTDIGAVSRQGRAIELHDYDRTRRLQGASHSREGKRLGSLDVDFDRG